MELVLGLALTGFICFNIFKLIVRGTKGLVRVELILFSKIVYVLNSLFVGLMAMVILYCLIRLALETKYAFGISLFLGMAISGLIIEFGHHSRHPRLEYFFHVAFGLMDGAVIGIGLDNYLLPRFFEEVPSVCSVAIIAMSVILMVALSFAEKKSYDFYKK